MPRENWTARFKGASIQGSDDMKTWTTLWTSTAEAESWSWQVITEFEDNRGYQYYRYWNGAEHGDVAELEFYGLSAEGYVPPTMAEQSTPVTEMTVSFDWNGIEGSTDPMTVTFGGTYEGLADLSVVDTAPFDGWYTSRTGGTRVTAETKVTHLGDHVLYAHWLPVGGAAPAPETEDISEEVPAGDQTDSGQEPEQQPVEEEGIRVVPIVCIAVSVLAIAAAAVVLLRNRDKDE